MNPGALKRKKLGEMLINQGRLTPDQLNDCLRLQKQNARPLGEILVEKAFITPDELTRLLGEQLGIPHVWLRKGLVDPRIVHVISKERALQFKVIPMFRVRNQLTLATADPNAVFVFREVARLTHLEVLPVMCRADDITEAINACYRENVSIDDVMSSIEESSLDVVPDVPEMETAELVEMVEGSPVANLTNLIITKAIRDGASDIHIEPQPGHFRIRSRIDGILYEMMAPKMEMHQPVVSRLKIMAKLDIAERRLPQDGRIQVRLDGRTVDLRFSSMPGVPGEKVVLRILDKATAALDLDRLGFEADVLKRFTDLLTRTHGLLLACGPTGSGKTSTLYSAISRINTPERNIVTIEDPVEFQFDGINQNQVKERMGLTFAKFIKHTLRQDPDIILVGEIRDRETAETAIQASLTGHLVLSSLHTNDSPSSITRLLEMGIESYLVSSALLGSLAQRLVRTICPQCRTTFYPPKEVLWELGVKEDRPLALAKGKGCPACYDSGFKGRTGIYELLELDGKLKQLVLNNPTADVIKQALSQHPWTTMAESGYRKVLAGLTTIEEVKRVVSTAA